MPRRVEDRLALRELNDEFAHALDHGELELFASLFTDDVFYRNGERVLTGRDEFEAFFTARAQSGRLSRHFYSGLVIEFTGEDEAIGHSSWLTFAGSGTPPIEGTQPFVIGDVKDLYRRNADGRWQFARREISSVFVNQAIKPLPTTYEPKA
jgi:uncharacterized protein (TIGR02246 family)